MLFCMCMNLMFICVSVFFGISPGQRAGSCCLSQVSGEVRHNSHVQTSTVTLKSCIFSHYVYVLYYHHNSNGIPCGDYIFAQSMSNL